MSTIKKSLLLLTALGTLMFLGCGGTSSTTASASSDSSVTESAYPIVDTGQTKCYNDSFEITAPASGAEYYGQDAQILGNQPSYTVSSNGLTVHDNVTDLTWQCSPDTNGDGSITASDKLTWTQAQARPEELNALGYGGFSDWRLPTIKELYSLMNFNGTDPSGVTDAGPSGPPGADPSVLPGADPSGVSGTDTSSLTPFIDTAYFKFAYGETSAGERIIDSQYASSTLYVSTASGTLLFGLNLADGRIKGYGLTLNGSDKTFFVQCVRGNTSYGVNSFTSNGDGTITDSATGLMWMQADSGTGMNWKDALAYAQTKNAANYLGHSDWRLPNAKELQSIVDYTRSPDTTSSAAIDALFSCTTISNEKGVIDYPFYWTGTTHAMSDGSGTAGVYVAFGRSMGYMNGTWEDVHGAGSQRSDPKIGDPADYPNGRGPQGDAIRIYNYVRLVRNSQ